MLPLKHLLFASLLVLVFVVPTSADPIQLTSGLLSVPDYRTSAPAPMQINGPNLSAQWTYLIPPQATCQMTCQTGVFNTFFNLSLISAGTPGLNAVVTIDGVTRTGFVTTFDGFFQTGPLVLPRVAANGMITITFPFRFSGRFNLREGVPVGPSELILSFDVVGEGWYTAYLEGFLFPNTEFYNLRGIDYNFTNPTPVPEPATLLLLAGGLAGVAAKMRR